MCELIVGLVSAERGPTYLHLPSPCLRWRCVTGHWQQTGHTAPDPAQLLHPLVPPWAAGAGCPQLHVLPPVCHILQLAVQPLPSREMGQVPLGRHLVLVWHVPGGTACATPHVPNFHSTAHGTEIAFPLPDLFCPLCRGVFPSCRNQGCGFPYALQHILHREGKIPSILHREGKIRVHLQGSRVTDFIWEIINSWGFSHRRYQPQVGRTCRDGRVQDIKQWFLKCKVNIGPLPSWVQTRKCCVWICSSDSDPSPH